MRDWKTFLFAKTEIGVVSGVYIEKTISGIKTLIPVTVNTPISNDKCYIP